MRSLDILLLVAALMLTIVLTGLIRNYARRANLLDVPNERSSHEIATPRGGGLSIVVVFLSSVLALWVMGAIDPDTAVAILTGGGLIAAIGFADDHSHVPASWRFLVQVVAATMVVTTLGGLPEIQFGNIVVDLGVSGDILTIVFMVWFTNAFNFMDGVDGIAASEAICIAGGALIILATGDSGVASSLLAALMATSSGFLLWNWPPAKIFMGDVGSGFVGFVLAMFAIISNDLGLLPIWSWLILAGVFVVDSTITLVTRMINGEEWHSAHNNHAYQKASRRLQGHRPVTLAVLIINLLWLLPIAWLASARPEFGLWLTVVAWIPLISLALFLKAGHPEPIA